MSRPAGSPPQGVITEASTRIGNRPNGHLPPGRQLHNAELRTHPCPPILTGPWTIDAYRHPWQKNTCSHFSVVRRHSDEPRGPLGGDGRSDVAQDGVPWLESAPSILPAKHKGLCTRRAESLAHKSEGLAEEEDFRSPSPRPRCSRPCRSRRTNPSRRRSRGSRPRSGTAPTGWPGSRP